MKLTPYWLDTATPSGDYRRNPVPERADIAIVGAGFTGLSAALEAARHGASVVVLDSHTVGWGASGRNGGMATTGLAIGLGKAIKRYGRPAGAGDVHGVQPGHRHHRGAGEGTLHRLRLPTLRQADPGHERQAGRPDAQDPADSRRPGRLPGDRRRQAGPAQRDRQRLLRRRHGGSAGGRRPRRQVRARPGRGGGPGRGHAVRERPGHATGRPPRRRSRRPHQPRRRACRPGPDRDQWLHRIADAVASAADHPGRQLHHRDRAAAAGNGPADPAPQPAGLRQQDAHLLLPDHPGHSAALRGTGQVRAVQPRLRRQERRDPASAR